MAIVQVKDATGSVLDWMVAKCEGTPSVRMFENSKGFRVYKNESMKMQGINFAPSTVWAQGGPIIEQEKIELIPPANESILEWVAVWYKCEDAGMQGGTSPLIAAMRCFCCSKLGDIVDVPEELCQ